MSFELLLYHSRTRELVPFEKRKRLRATHVPFSGSPRAHGLDPDRLLLVADPFSSGSHYLEFSLSDVDFVEKLPSLVTVDGESINMARIWVRKGSLGLRLSPFVVEDTAGAAPAASLEMDPFSW
ncbi:MAG: inorganic pyrophosphatase Ppa [Proteobacteria bacterium]|nr:inorganic pyrophosphatase Ppa [Pseudomonadota bacterium]